MARRLYLLRHAKSSWDDPALADHDRPLAKRGRKACKLIASHLSEHGVEPEAAIVSSAVRTQETYERIRGGLPDGIESWTEPRVYQADADELLELLRELPDSYGSVILIGHNPAMQELTVMLAGEGEELERVRRKYPTAALATLWFDGGWTELRPRLAILEDFVRPKQLKD